MRKYSFLIFVAAVLAASAAWIAESDASIAGDVHIAPAAYFRIPSFKKQFDIEVDKRVREVLLEVADEIKLSCPPGSPYEGMMLDDYYLWKVADEIERAAERELKNVR